MRYAYAPQQKTAVLLFARENNTQARASQVEAEISCGLLLPRLQVQGIQARENLGALLIDAFEYELHLLNRLIHRILLRQMWLFRLYRIEQLPRTQKRCGEQNSRLGFFGPIGSLIEVWRKGNTGYCLLFHRSKNSLTVAGAYLCETGREKGLEGSARIGYK